MNISSADMMVAWISVSPVILTRKGLVWVANTDQAVDSPFQEFCSKGKWKMGACFSQRGCKGYTRECVCMGRYRGSLKVDGNIHEREILTVQKTGGRIKMQGLSLAPGNQISWTFKGVALQMNER